MSALLQMIDNQARESFVHAFREGSEVFAAAFEQSPLAMALVGADYRLIKVNLAFSALLRYDPQELERLTFVDITHPEDLDVDTDLASRLFAETIRTYSLEKRYVSKDGAVIPIELTATILRTAQGEPICGLATIRDLTDQRNQRQELLDRINCDPATGLPNRLKFQDQANQVLAEVRAFSDLALAVAFIDIDNFKSINDEFGHVAGDYVICEISARLKAAVRTDDLVARYGGDEFAALFVAKLPPRQLASITAKRLRRVCSFSTEWEGELLKVTGSIGVLATVGSFDYARIMAEVDAAMYEAKSRKFGGVVIREI